MANRIRKHRKKGKILFSRDNTRHYVLSRKCTRTQISRLQKKFPFIVPRLSRRLSYLRRFFQRDGTKKLQRSRDTCCSPSPDTNLMFRITRVATTLRILNFFLFIVFAEFKKNFTSLKILNIFKWKCFVKPTFPRYCSHRNLYYHFIRWINYYKT